MSDRRLRIGTRGSALARAQTALVAGPLEGRGWAVEIVTIRTSGDRGQISSLPLVRGVFVKELERALREGAIDLAVHSAKDMPTDEPDDLPTAAYPPRGDARDAVVTRDGADLAALPAGARVGTESPRRRAFVLLERSDLAVVPIRGNVDTRLRRLEAGEVDALILAAAGLERLGLSGRIAETLPTARMLPAPGQGALAVQARAGAAAAAVAPLDDAATRRAVTAERSFLAAMGGGCRAPFAALATSEAETLRVEGAAVEPDGRDVVRAVIRGPGTDAAALGRGLATTLLTMGAGAMAGKGNGR